MKKMKLFKLIVASVLLLNVNFSKAQMAPFTNHLQCDVTVFIEVWAGPGGSRGPDPCSGQSVGIPANTTVMVDLTNLCAPNTFNDLCIIVTQIGSCSVNTGVHLTSTCHIPSSSTDSGTLNTNCCGGILNWNAAWNSNTHTFDIF